MEQKISIIPNTTQVPNIFLDEWIGRLKDTEFKILMIITRQTFGWIEDKETGRRKEKDWISVGYLIKKIQRSHTAISRAIDGLIKNGLIEALDEQGNQLETPEKRIKHGGKIFYRVKTISPPITLFNTPQESRGVLKKDQPRNFLAGKKVATTKEILLQNIAKASKLDLEIKNQGKNGLKADKTDRQKLPTNALIGDFSRYCQAIRGVKPEFVQFKDGNLIKCALKYLSAGQIELLFIWFLREKVLMDETIGAALCKEVIADFIETSHKEYGFYRRLEETALTLMRKTEQEIKIETSAMVEALAKFKAEAFKNILTPAERTEIQIENAAAERAAK